MKKVMFNRKLWIVLFLLVLILCLGIMYFGIRYEGFCLETLKTIFTIIGFLVASCFFIYKILTGWLIINLNINIDAERNHIDKDNDHLVIHILLTKGQTDSLWLKNIAIKVIELDGPVKEEDLHQDSGKPKIIRPVGMERISSEKDWQPEGKGRLLTISPSEEARFSAYIQVNSLSVVVLEVVVLGTRPFYGIENKNIDFIQWKASKIVLPVR
ncbi:hypothetical protein OQX61_23980 [Pedobacter sp. PLR]|uniref:hypothetical protein n=1 Tax=Pedobacter sp. PLR TaxID=2994465 RepID=UPI002245B6AF|nr:hypothetical protein [Pedobacter sp. PLR]MCX2454351.1 hypothetical protein [Pedobacter sp. PLR]